VVWQIAQVEDSFQELASFQDASADVVLTDPPYSEHVQGNMFSASPGGIRKVELPFEALQGYAFARDLVRVARRWALAFCAMEDFGLYRAVVGAEQWVRSGVWIKSNAMGQLTKDRPANAYEGISIMHRKGEKKRWNGKGSHGFWTCDDPTFFPSEESILVCKNTRGVKDRHPNQKPLDLCLELVAKFTERGETVLDPFAGSASIGEACVLLGRNYIGLERDGAWVEKASRRLEAAEQAAPLRDEDCMRLCALKRGEKEKEAA
jgi:DNA modification methylase